MTRNTPSTGTADLPASDLRIQIRPLLSSIFRGTRVQLVGEGLIPDWLVWPSREQGTNWVVGHLRYSLQSCWAAGQVALPGTAPPGDCWALIRTPVELPGVTFAARRQQSSLARKAKTDKAYQAFRLQLHVM